MRRIDRPGAGGAGDFLLFAGVRRTGAKRLALANAERLADRGRPDALAGDGWLAGGVAGGAATDTVLALMRRSDLPGPSVSIEDIHLIKTGTSEGLLEPAEQMVARRALRLGDRTVREIMRPRIEIDALDVDTPPEEVIGAAAMAGFSRLPVHEGDMDHVIGFVYVKDLLLQYHLNRPMNLRKMVRPALLVPATMPIDRLLETFRQPAPRWPSCWMNSAARRGWSPWKTCWKSWSARSTTSTAWTAKRTSKSSPRPRNWLVDAGVNLDALFARLGWGEVPASPARDFSSLGGLVISQLGHIPRIGDRTSWNGLDLEVLEMDGPRLDRILVTLREGGSAKP